MSERRHSYKLSERLEALETGSPEHAEYIVPYLWADVIDLAQNKAGEIALANCPQSLKVVYLEASLTDLSKELEAWPQATDELVISQMQRVLELLNPDNEHDDQIIQVVATAVSRHGVSLEELNEAFESFLNSSNERIAFKKALGNESEFEERLSSLLEPESPFLGTNDPREQATEEIFYSADQLIGYIRQAAEAARLNFAREHKQARQEVDKLSASVKNRLGPNISFQANVSRIFRKIEETDVHDALEYLRSQFPAHYIEAGLAYFTPLALDEAEKLLHASRQETDKDEKQKLYSKAKAIVGRVLYPNAEKRVRAAFNWSLIEFASPSVITDRKEKAFILTEEAIIRAIQIIEQWAPSDETKQDMQEIVDQMILNRVLVLASKGRRDESEATIAYASPKVQPALLKYLPDWLPEDSAS